MILNIFSVPPTRTEKKKQLIPCQLQLWFRFESQKKWDEKKSGSEAVNENMKQYLWCWRANLPALADSKSQEHSGNFPTAAAPLTSSGHSN